MLKKLKIRKLIMMVVCGLLSFIPLTFAAQISYHPNSTIKSKVEYDPQTGKRIKQHKQSPSKTLGRSFFHQQTKSPIKLADTETLKQEWLNI
ncbi:DUF2963 domain-containing protein [Mulberry dwarf phytoplasma]|uniref:DUF2963 domain-containing protein n=1 Tax=Mulberry dwarf phytoplasma TaxID=186171 RepID=UPI001D0FA949|nr:hypothetical protein [Mulberry dwarf phytoplasma]